MGGMTYNSERATRRIAMITKALDDGLPRTSAQISRLVFCTSDTAANYMRHMHDAGLVRIKKWFRRGCPMYVLGPGKDAKMPERKSPSKAQQDYHRRHKSDPEYQMRLERRREAKKIMPGWAGDKRRFIGGQPSHQSRAA